MAEAGGGDVGHSEGYSSWAACRMGRKASGGSGANAEKDSGRAEGPEGTKVLLGSGRGHGHRRIRMGGRQLLKLRALLQRI